MKKIIFCIPGNNFSRAFLESWTATLDWCRANNIIPELRTYVGSNVYYVRNGIVGGYVKHKKRDVVFEDMDYDFSMWIDSDTVWHPELIWTLMKHDLDIVSGLCPVSESKYGIGLHTGPDFFHDTSSFRFLEKHEEDEMHGTVKCCAFCGFAFVLVKKGVFEKMQSPWFRPVWQELNAGHPEFSSEDAGFCDYAKSYGFHIHFDPQVRVRHEKARLL